MGFIDNIKECFLGGEFIGEPCFRAVLFGDTAMYFENVRTILHYDIEEISLGLKKGSVLIRGQNLFIKKYCEGDVIVCGQIRAIERVL